MIVTAQTSSLTPTSPTGQRRRRYRPPPAAADRGRCTCERTPMLPDQDASRRQRSSAHFVVATPSRDRRLDHSGRYPRATAEVPAVPGSICGGLDWNRAFVLGRDTLTHGTCDSMRRIHFISGGKKHAPPRSQI